MTFCVVKDSFVTAEKISIFRMVHVFHLNSCDAMMVGNSAVSRDPRAALFDNGDRTVNWTINAVCA